MSKVAVVYWSSTGNTEAMADAVVNGAKEKGADVTLYECADFRPELVGEYDAIAFGCPAMGDEVLEEDEFEPMFDDCKDALKDKKIALFGSYGWGDGEWMRNWEESCKEAGAVREHPCILPGILPEERIRSPGQYKIRLCHQY